ncbi:hypothetical protein ABKN59_010895 [Abortiporus biennis]
MSIDFAPLVPKLKAISGVNVPRDVSTCAGCPMECGLSHSSDKWSCQVSIREEFDVWGHRLNEVQERPFGGRIYVKKDVKLLKFERMPFTQNNHYLSDTKQKWFAKYKDARALTRNQSTPSTIPSASVPIQLTFSSISNSTKSPFQFGASSNKNESSSSTQSESTLRNSSNVGSFQSTNDKGSPPLSGIPASQVSILAKQVTDDRKEALKALAKSGCSGLTVEDLRKLLLASDEFEEEMEIMAEVKAYFQLYYKTFIDIVSMSIDHEFLFEFFDSLQLRLIDELQLGASHARETCAAYLEDPSVTLTKNELNVKKTVFKDVLAQY